MFSFVLLAVWPIIKPEEEVVKLPTYRQLVRNPGGTMRPGWEWGQSHGTESLICGVNISSGKLVSNRIKLQDTQLMSAELESWMVWGETHAFGVRM